MFLRLMTAACVTVSCLVPAPSAASHPAAFAIQAVQQEKPDHVLAKAKEIYAADGPKQALPVFERALSLYRDAAIAAGRQSPSASSGTATSDSATSRRRSTTSAAPSR